MVSCFCTVTKKKCVTTSRFTILCTVAWLKVFMELIWTTVLLLASPQKKKKSRGLKPSAKQILLIPGNEKCCDCGKLYLCQTSGFSLWDCLFVGLSCAVSRSRCSKNPAPSGKRHMTDQQIYFSVWPRFVHTCLGLICLFWRQFLFKIDFSYFVFCRKIEGNCSCNRKCSFLN